MNISQIYQFLILMTLISVSACSQIPKSSKHDINKTVVNYETGKASYYADKFQGRQTANGERFNQNILTAAHKSLPFGTLVKVRNIKNGKAVVVRINDRGPFIKGRIIDLSKSAFTAIANRRLGVVDVIVDIIR